MTVGELKAALLELDLPNDFQVRMGGDAERFDYLEAVGADNDTGVLILYCDGEKEKAGKEKI